jgi:CSLREA domain-containing protein
MKQSRVRAASCVLAAVTLLALSGILPATVQGDRNTGPVLLNDLTVTGLIHDASLGERRPLPHAALFADICQQDFTAFAGPDGRYSLFIPASAVNGCDHIAFLVQATSYADLELGVPVAALSAHPQQDFGLWPAADIVVNTTDDELNADGDCSLREAIQAANTDQAVDACPAGGGSDTLSVPAGTYELALVGADENANATGDLDILDDLKLIGAGIKGSLLDGKALDRVLHAHGGATVQITGVMITGGRTPDGADSPSGGGDAEPGGAIANLGDLILTQCAVSGNRTGDGGDLVGGSGFGGPPGGNGGNGGGIYNAGALQLMDAWVVDNLTGNGGTAGDPAGIGLAGAGGGIYNAGKLTLSYAVVERNRTGTGGSFVMPPGAVGGPGSDGGGIYNAGAAAIVYSTIQDNQAGQGQNAGSHGTAGKGGAGGGIYNAGELLLRQSTVSGNAAGDGGIGLACGPGGDGGGITSTGNSLWLANSTVSGNSTGAGGVSIIYGPCASGSGGGVYTTGGITSDNSTIAANRTGEGIGGDGGGILIADRYISMRNTILAGNAAAGEGPDCKAFWGSPGPTLIELRGNNLVQETAGCILVEAPNADPSIIGKDPVLLPLGKYGGPTLTHALGLGSPAIDAGNCTDTRGDPVTVDQRGVARPQGKACDIGAFEGVRTGVYLPLVLK